jgi:hypothetical protein
MHCACNQISNNYGPMAVVTDWVPKDFHRLDDLKFERHSRLPRRKPSPIWTENWIASKRLRAEAELGDKHGKLICLRDPKLAPGRHPDAAGGERSHH